jgi:radical SAM superfamily enzyme
MIVGRDMVDFLEKGLIHHVAEELGCQTDNADTATRLERAFLMADIHSHQAGVQASGATVALCLVKVSTGLQLC